MTEPYAELGGRPSTATPPLAARGCGQRICNHPDNHDCPWLTETDSRGKAIPCPCWHQVAEKGGRG
jgi:hypothetical protein